MAHCYAVGFACFEIKKVIPIDEVLITDADKFFFKQLLPLAQGGARNNGIRIAFDVAKGEFVFTLNVINIGKRIFFCHSVAYYAQHLFIVRHSKHF